MNCSCDLLLEFWDTLYISATVESIHFIFGMQISQEGFLTKNVQSQLKGSCQVSHGLVLQFRDPLLHISLIVDARNVKFGIKIGHEWY